MRVSWASLRERPPGPSSRRTGRSAGAVSERETPATTVPPRLPSSTLRSGGPNGPGPGPGRIPSSHQAKGPASLGFVSPSSCDLTRPAYADRTVRRSGHHGAMAGEPFRPAITERQVPDQAHTVGPGRAAVLDQLHHDLLALDAEYRIGSFGVKCGGLRITVADRCTGGDAVRPARRRGRSPGPAGGGSVRRHRPLRLHRPIGARYVADTGKRNAPGGRAVRRSRPVTVGRMGRIATTAETALSR